MKISERFEKISKKICNCRMNYKKMYICLLTLTAVLLIPMLLIGRYDIPSSDDFGHCVWTHPVYEQTGSVLQTVLTAFKWVGYCFNNISGTFTVQVFDALAPNTFGESLYFITPFIMLFSLIFGVVYFEKTFFTYLYPSDKTKSRIIELATIIVMTQFLPSSIEGFYWYVGAITYTFYFSLFLILASIALRFYYSESKKYKMLVLVLCPFLAFVLGGGNHVTSLVTGVVVVSLIIVSVFNKKRFFFYLPSLIFWMIAFTVLIIAPGNKVRSEAVGGGAGLVKSFFLAFRAVALSAEDWLSIPVLMFILLIIPIIWSMASKSDKEFRYPAVVSALSVCFLAAMFYPPYFGMNSMGQGRVKNIIFFAFILLIICNLYYWCGWISKHADIKWLSEWDNGINIFFIAVLAVGVIFGMVATVKIPVTSYSAVKSLISGEAEEYYETEQKRIEILSSDEKNIVLPAFESKPYTIYFTDITEDAEDGMNMAMAEYYSKDSIIVGE